MFVSHIFSDNFGPNIWSSLNWLKFRTWGALQYAYYDLNVYFFKMLSFM